jgi:hypothetical protein
VKTANSKAFKHDSTIETYLASSIADAPPINEIDERRSPNELLALLKSAGRWWDKYGSIE